MSYPEFQKFRDAIAHLTPTQLSDKTYLQENFRVLRKGRFDVTYTPFDYINKEAKICIIGITPGFTQLKNSLTEANRCLNLGLSDEQVLKSVKTKGAFSTPPNKKKGMREFLVEMLDKIQVNRWLGIKSCLELFGDKSHLVHTCSLIKNTTFKIKKDSSTVDYSGGKDDILKKDAWELVEQSFIPMVSQLPEDIIYLPLGPTVDSALSKLVRDGILKEENAMYEIPLPSGQNSGRIDILLGKRTEPFKTCEGESFQRLLDSKERAEAFFSSR